MKAWRQHIIWLIFIVELFFVYGQEPENVVALPAPPPTSANPSGVNMTELTSIQSQIDSRVDKLDDMAISLSKGLDDVEKFSPSVLLKGIDLEAQVIDTEQIAEQLKARENARLDKNPEITRAAREAYVGEQTPPIVILESSGLHPLEHHLIMKLLNCREDDIRKEEAKQKPIPIETITDLNSVLENEEETEE